MAAPTTASKAILRRALLYVPGSSPKMLNKANSLTVDNLTLDLEDSVTTSQKASARTNVSRVLSAGRPPGVRELAVRINAVSSGLAEDDLAATLIPGVQVDAVVVPKVDSPSDLKFITDALTHAGPQFQSTKIIALIESARAVMDIRAICSTPTSGRLSGLIFAAEDFALDLSLTRTPGLTEFLLARQTVVAAARAYGLPSAIDLVCTAYKDLSVLEEECKGGRGMGFNGKQCIHPAQVEVVQRAFAPGESQVRESVRVMVAEQKAEERGWGSWGLQGRMVDRPVIEAARATVERAREAGMGEMVQRMEEEEGGTEPNHGKE